MVERLEDGSVVGMYPLGDVEWAVRYVLQYGKEAEVVGPEEVKSTAIGFLRKLRTASPR
jgi:predicted DNA-binding transcriptional regulator YafY